MSARLAHSRLKDTYSTVLIFQHTCQTIFGYRKYCMRCIHDLKRATIKYYYSSLYNIRNEQIVRFEIHWVAIQFIFGLWVPQLLRHQ